MNQVSQYLGRLFAQMDRGVSIADIMRADERDAGYKVVVPGDVPWLPIADWDPSIVVSLDRDRVRLVAILALNPGNGAFRRLIAAIEATNLTPQIITPTNEMRTTVKRWGWRSRTKGTGFGVQEIWYPRHSAKRRD